MITNKVNGKRYIGQTSQELSRRWHAHCSAKKYTPLVRAIKKYGKNNFEIKVLCRCNTVEEMNHREQHYIKLFNTLSPNGYNLLPGGRNSLHTSETKAKISRANKGKRKSREWVRKLTEPKIGRPLSEAHKRKLRIARKGKQPNLGKRFSKSWRRKIGLASRGRKMSDEAKRKISLANTGRKRPDLAERNRARAKGKAC